MTPKITVAFSMFSPNQLLALVLGPHRRPPNVSDLRRFRRRPTVAFAPLRQQTSLRGGLERRRRSLQAGRTKDGELRFQNGKRFQTGQSLKAAEWMVRF